MIGNVICFLIGLWVGGGAGILVMGLCNAAAWADRGQEPPETEGKWYYPERPANW